MTSDERGEGKPAAAKSRERRIAEIVGRCSDRINAGERVDIEAVLRECPDLASELREDLEALVAMRPELRALPQASTQMPQAEAGAIAEDSVLGALSSITGGSSSVLLPDPHDEVSPVVVPGSAEVPGDARVLGGYEVFGEIGRGGIGVVLKGRDRDLGRDVALKLLLGSHEKNPQMVRRFIEEAQIGGQLQHPGIVPVYRLGVFLDRRPFFAMKLVKGRTLAALLAERRDGSQDRLRFLGIFQQVCQTLAYAHARGVIHRDLKPSNVMVGSFGEVQVMDWGLAKVMASGGVDDERRAKRVIEEKDEIHTVRSGTPGSESKAGAVLGTPAYMSPEQARGDVDDLDQRTDVFGLGAILCEILTGKPPYARGVGEGASARARGGDLGEAFGTLERCGAEAEIVRIAKSCLSPERNDRPRNAGVVAAELASYLASVEDRARRAEVSAAASLVKAVEERKRRRVTVALAATVVLSLVLGGGTWAYRKADRDARLARITRDANDALTQATGLRERAKAAGLVDVNLWAQAREQAQRAATLLEGGPADPHLDAKIRQLLADLEVEEKDRQLLAALDAAWMAQTETDVQKNWFSSERCIPLFRDAFQSFGLGVGEKEAREAAARIAGRPKEVRDAAIAAMDEWILQSNNLSPKVEEPHLRWLKEVVAGADPDPWRQAFRAAIGQADIVERRAALLKLAATAEIARQPIREVTLLAGQMADMGAREAAAKLLTLAQHEHPGDFWVNDSLGKVLQHLGRSDEALRHLTAAAALRPNSPGTLLNLAWGFERAGKHDEGIDILRKVLDQHPDYANAHYNLGVCLFERGEFEEGIAECRKAIALHPSDSATHNNLGTALHIRGKLEEAIAEYGRAIELNPEYALAHDNLGCALHDQGKLEEAIAELRKSFELDPDGGAQDHLAMGLAEQGRSLARKKDFRGAVLALEQALDLPNASRADFTALESYRQAALPDIVSYGSIASLLEREAILPEGAEWRFFRGREEPSDGPGWTGTDFDDSAWEKGPSGFGYENGDDATLLSDMEGEYSTVYLRRAVEVEESVPWKSLSLWIAADDGFVAYLNGQEVGRHSAGSPGALIPFDGTATEQAKAPLTPIRVPIDASLLHPGRNVFAIQGLNFGKDNAGFSLIPVLLGEPVPDPERDRKRFEEFRAQADGEGAQNLVAYLDGALLERDGKLREAAARFAEVAGSDRTRPEPFLRLAGCLRALGDARAAEARAREGLDAGFRENGKLWDLWFAISAVDLKRSPEDVLALLPEGRGDRDMRRSDLKWALEELKSRKVIRIHCGGGPYWDSRGNLWGADRFFASGFRTSVVEKIQGTEDGPLYQTERRFRSFCFHPHGYRVPLPPGRYRVTLHFAEISYPEAGKRRFHVRIEGQEVMTDFEPVSAGFRTASKKSLSEPVGSCGVDPTLDGLTCEAFGGCP